MNYIGTDRTISSVRRSGDVWTWRVAKGDVRVEFDAPADADMSDLFGLAAEALGERS